jgi:hypothetical protein
MIFMHFVVKAQAGRSAAVIIIPAGLYDLLYITRVYVYLIIYDLGGGKYFTAGLKIPFFFF